MSSHDIIRASLQKYYSALKSLNDFAQVGDLYDDIANLDRIRHINGNTNNPIFGIDINEKEESEYPEVHRFTKTFRRLQQDALNLSDIGNGSNDSIEGAVVFGHSLNMMDFDYFSYLFTVLNFNTFDISKMGSIEFVYKSHSNNPDKERN